MKIAKVGIIGAGQMGAGIAQVCATAGYDVLVNDTSPERIKAGLDNIAGNFNRRIKSGKATEEMKASALSKIKPATSLAAFGDCDLVIEAASEKEAVKKQIFEALAPHLKADCILGTNTSSLSITRLAATSGRPEKFMGIHFMNPVPVMELVELIRGIATDEAVFKTVNEFVATLGKTIAVSEDFPAFIVNRILLPMINEAVYTLYEGVGGVEAIDKAMKLGAHLAQFRGPQSTNRHELSASAPAFRRDSRRSHAAPCGRASRPRHI